MPHDFDPINEIRDIGRVPVGFENRDFQDRKFRRR